MRSRVIFLKNQAKRDLDEVLSDCDREGMENSVNEAMTEYTSTSYIELRSEISSDVQNIVNDVLNGNQIMNSVEDGVDKLTEHSDWSNQMSILIDRMSNTTLTTEQKLNFIYRT